MSSQDKKERDSVLRALLLARGAWVPASQISELSTIWFSHVLALRAIGFTIRERRNGNETYFRLQREAVKHRAPSFPEFGDLLKGRYPD